MRKVRLIANCIDEIIYDSTYDYIGVDKGALLCMNQNIPMVYALGDFDSIDKESYTLLNEYTSIIKLPCQKNESDGEYAISYAHELKYDVIEVYGVSGGRLDHFLAILNLLIYGNINFKIIDSNNCIYTLNKGEYNIQKNSKYISFFACEDLYLTLSNVLYPLDHVLIKKSDIYLISNEIFDNAYVNTSGKLLVIESDDKKNDVR